MTLMGAILKQVHSLQSIKSKGSGITHSSPHGTKSPPPETEVIEVLEKEKKRRARKGRCSFARVLPKVDASPPRYHARGLFCKMLTWSSKKDRLAADNFDIVLAIAKTHLHGGRVDSHWKVPPKPCLWAYENRVNELKRIAADNKILYSRITSQGPKIVTTESLMKDWARNREDILLRATEKFVLFPPIPTEDMEDPAFVKPRGVKRPRVFFTVRMEGCSDIGELQAELFTDVCPRTCQLFAELLAGDGVGYSYIGTHFYRKVPHLYWAGGDVTRDNGFGCYAQKGRRVPIGAENYHFSHSMPGLLSMAVTCDNEVCGIFNITFKALPQLDLRNVVFGRIIRPSEVLNGISHIGAALATRPPVILSASRRKVHGKWVLGTPNYNMEPTTLVRRIQS